MDIMQIYKNANALLEGHFLLSSGKHSPFYLQSAKIMISFMNPSKIKFDYSDLMT